MHFKNRFRPDKSWSLFLDRDGVINQRIIDEYVLKPSDFIWLEGVKESMTFFAEVFGTIVVVTNQQGIGKGLMTAEDLEEIHTIMLNDIHNEGGRIDKVYHCPDLREEFSFCRKPSPGMALKARKDFPKIRFNTSVMVGDTLSDMEFGKKLKMTTVLISTDKTLISDNYRLIDLAFKSLADFADYLRSFSS